jgi:hypothetical protein
MTAEFIQFEKPSITTRRVAVHNAVANKAQPLAERSLTVTAKNARLRNALKKAWREANAATEYWHALLRIHDANSIAADLGMREACLRGGEFNNETRWGDLERYGEAVRKQMLTAAPHAVAVNWKRTHLRDASFIGVNQQRLEQVIAEDEAFLKAHPTHMARAASNES